MFLARFQKIMLSGQEVITDPATTLKRRNGVKLNLQYKDEPTYFLVIKEIAKQELPLIKK